MPPKFESLLKPAILFTLFLGMSWNSCHAQLNILTGANFGFSGSNALSSSIKEYNSDNNDLVKDLDLFNSMYGFSMGARYRYEIIGINVGYTIRLKKLEAQFATDNEIEEFNLRKNGIFFGPEFFLGSSIFSFGANLSYDTFKAKYKTSVQSNDLTIMSDKVWNTQIYLSLRLSGSDNTSLLIRPFYEFSLKDYNISGVRNQLDLNTGSNNFGFSQLGFSVILANGPSN